MFTTLERNASARYRCIMQPGCGTALARGNVANLARKGSQVDRVAEEARRLLGEAKKEAAELNLNLVRIQFSAECCQDGVWRTLCCVYSNPVANSSEWSPSSKTVDTDETRPALWNASVMWSQLRVHL